MAAVHGKNAYVYVGGVAFVGANAWSIGMTADVVESTEFGNTWKPKLAGMLDGTGSLTAWQHQDRRELIDAVAGLVAVLTYIYPDRTDATNFIYGSVLYTTYSGDGSTTTPIAGNADFVTSASTAGLTFSGFA